MDMLKVFLYRFLDEVIYIEQPQIFELNLELVFHLGKALYGLKQAPQVCYKTIADFLKKLGLERLEFDHGIFVS